MVPVTRCLVLAIKSVDCLVLVNLPTMDCASVVKKGGGVDFMRL